MSQAYAQAIDLLMNGNLDFRQICIDLAKENPKVFVEMADRKPPEDWCRHIINLIRKPCSNGISCKVECIKELRSATGLPLKESKEIIEQVMWELDHDSVTPMPHHMTTEMLAMINRIMRAAK